MLNLLQYIQVSCSGTTLKLNKQKQQYSSNNTKNTYLLQNSTNEKQTQNETIRILKLNEINLIKNRKTLETETKIPEKKNSSINEITDISFAKNYLTFSQLSNGLSDVKNISVVIFKNLSHQIRNSQFNYILLCLALLFLLTLIFLFFKNLQENSKFHEIITGKLSFNAKQNLNNENKILLKGRTVYRPANKYHYLLEKNFNDDQSVLSNETEDNIAALDDKELSKFYYDFPSFLPQNQSKCSNSNLQFGKIFNNNENETKMKHCSDIDQLFANTLIPNTEKIVENLQIGIVSENSIKKHVEEEKESIIINFTKELNKNGINFENFNEIYEDIVDQKDLKKEKISYLLQNHFCEETIITRCSIPLDFKFKNNINK